jgi:hypothetical protein
LLCREFEELSAAGIKVGENVVHNAIPSEVEMGAQQNDDDDTSCGLTEEGQDASETLSPSESSGKPSLSSKLPADDV